MRREWSGSNSSRNSSACSVLPIVAGLSQGVRERRNFKRKRAGGVPSTSLSSSRSSLRVMIRSEKMQGHVRLVADHPTVVGDRRDVEQRAGGEIDRRAVGQGRYRMAGDDESNVLDLTQRRTGQWPHVLGPFPAGLVCRAADGNAADPDDLELAALEL